MRRYLTTGSARVALPSRQVDLDVASRRPDPGRYSGAPEQFDDNAGQKPSGRRVLTRSCPFPSQPSFLTIAEMLVHWFLLDGLIRAGRLYFLPAQRKQRGRVRFGYDLSYDRKRRDPFLVEAPFAAIRDWLAV